MSFGNVAAIVQKEWRHYFGSPIAWVGLFVWTMLFGIFFSFSFHYFLEYTMRMTQQAMEYGGGGMKASLNEMLIRPVLQNMSVVTLFIIPILTMRLFAEEKRQGTIELLATSPLRDFEIVFGKFLSAAGLYGLMIVSGLVNVLLIYVYAPTRPEWKPILTGALALFLLGSCFIAAGLVISALTKNQIIAAIVAFCLFLGLWTLGWAEDPAASPIMKGVAYLGVTTHMEDLMKGVVDTKDLIFYLSFIAFGLFATQQALESQRWRA